LVILFTGTGRTMHGRSGTSRLFSLMRWPCDPSLLVKSFYHG
jgi:hypothetical protein